MDYVDYDELDDRFQPEPEPEETDYPDKHWHAKHEESLTIGEQIADWIAATMGSWPFIIGQTVFLICWIIFNVWAILFDAWDPYPFVFLNLMLSFQAAYAAPFIMISQNRQSQRDRAQAEMDYQTNLTAKEEIENLQKHLSRLEIEKLTEMENMLKDTLTTVLNLATIIEGLENGKCNKDRKTSKRS